MLVIFGLELRTLPRNRPHVRGRGEHQSRPCLAPFCAQPMKLPMLTGSMQVAFRQLMPLSAHDRAMHLHRSAPVGHDRIGLPPDVPAVVTEALVFGGIGYAFFALRRGYWCGSRINLFAQLRTGSEQLNDFRSFGVIPHDSTARTFAMEAAKPSMRWGALSARSLNIHASRFAIS